MRLQTLTISHVRSAVELYLEAAYPDGPPEAQKQTLQALRVATNLRQVRTLFESPRAADHVTCRRFTLRLGNCKYPFMKLVIQEYLVEGEYFFSVDTHDELKVTPQMADYEQWLELRRFNGELKDAIELSWAQAHLPTHEDLRGLMEEIAARSGGPCRAGKLLVVDDEDDVAQGVAAVLRSRGFQVEVAFDGGQVLQRLEENGAFDLIVLDFSMPTMTGEEVIQRIRSDERFKDQPVLMATASDIDQARVPSCAAYLRKPYPKELLLAMVDQLLGCE
ncbi:MAG: response regulator [Planctomycetota bacterium]|nr:response regulator [Planctomycetota bacterium]